ncbi:uncharacterized protein LOC135378625 [Ornithodoros turicata]|uniref:uncharacterized protein LOC135378625 n=1 Tax=Ornithodoros turicata TaxID=34597 RepID=UPI00313A19C2
MRRRLMMHVIGRITCHTQAFRFAIRDAPQAAKEDAHHEMIRTHETGSVLGIQRIAVQTYSMGDHRLHLLRYLLQRNSTVNMNCMRAIMLSSLLTHVDEQHESPHLALSIETSSEELDCDLDQGHASHHVLQPADTGSEEHFSLDEQHRSRQLALPGETSLEDVGSEQEPCPTHHVALPAEMHLEEVYSCSSSEEARCADQGAHNSASSTSDVEQYFSDDGAHEKSHPFDSDSLNVKV